MMQTEFDTIKTRLLNDQQFIQKLTNRIQQGPKLPIKSDVLENIIEQLQSLLQILIKRKMQQQLWGIIAQNNKVLQQIKQNLSKTSNNILRPNLEIENSNILPDNSFSDIHNIISEERRKALDCMNDAQVQKSLSVLEKYEDVVQKVNSIQKKVKCMEDRYQTNFKSLWNVLSMTQAAVFDHIKQNKNTKKNIQESSKQTQKEAGMFKIPFWK